MAIRSNKLKEVKTALKSMSKGSHGGITKAEFIASLIKDIHEKMLAGFKLEEIWEEVNKPLDEQDKITLNTFRTYVRKAREEAGMEATRSWTRRTEKPVKDASKKDAKEDKKEDVNEGFRDQGGDL